MNPKNLMKKFDELKVIGDGGFGIVTKCKDRETGNEVAVKKMKQRFSSFEQCLQLKEVKSLRKIKHENVVKLLQVFRENEYLYLVFELLGESLQKTISHRDKPFSNEEVRYIAHQILNGLAVVHKQGFFHRDIKPDNLLWGDNNLLKIADFGLAREIRSRPPYTEYIGTRWYRAPEIILRHPFYNSPVDMWSVGCILMELYTLRPVFPGTTESDQFFKYMNILGTPNPRTWPDFQKLCQKSGFKFSQIAGSSIQSAIPKACPEAVDLISQLLRWDPAARPSASRALQHPFFQGSSIPPPLPNTVYIETSKVTPQKEKRQFAETYSVGQTKSEMNFKSSNPEIWGKPINASTSYFA